MTLQPQRFHPPLHQRQRMAIPLIVQLFSISGVNSNCIVMPTPYQMTSARLKIRNSSPWTV